MSRGDYILGGVLAVVIAISTIGWVGVSRDMHYRWTTPPDEMCNVWEH